MWQVTRNGGREPLWTREGREIVYRDGNRILSIAFSGDTNEPAFDKPEKLFEEESLWPGHRNYDVTADGERFLMVRVNGLPALTHINVVLNWPEELARLED